MKLIELSKQGSKYKGKYFALVDNSDYDTLIQYRWSVCKPKKSLTVYAGAEINGKYRLMHKIIFPEFYMIDHSDRNGLNNQRNNLRECTHIENMRNFPSKGKSKFKGVYFSSRDKNWHSSIKSEFKRVYLGHFNNEIDAAKAYNKAAIIHHGTFATLNLI